MSTNSYKRCQPFGCMENRWAQQLSAVEKPVEWEADFLLC